MFDYIRIGGIVPAVRLGNSTHNAEQICKWIRKADSKDCDIILFPELTLTGYTCADLFHQKCLQDSVIQGLEMIIQCTAEFPAVTIAVGAPLLLQGQLFNCAVMISAGRIRGIVPKTYLPNDGPFNESRWFLGANDLRCNAVDSQDLGLSGDYEIPVGNDLIFQVGEGTLVAAEICEDLFAPISPSAPLTLNGAEVMLNLSASPATVGKQICCRQLVSHQSAVCNCAYAYVSAGYTESNQDMVYTGQSLVAENGTVVAESKEGIAAEGMLVCDVDLGVIRAERQRNNAVRSATAGYLPTKPARVIKCQSRDLRADGTRYPLRKCPFLPAEGWQTDCRATFQVQSMALARRLEKLNAKAVVGVSGGLDSTLALLVAVEACRILGRPSSDVVGITMPCFGTTGRTYNNALKLMEALGITAQTIDIKDAVLNHFEDIGQDPTVCNTTYENAQARERTQVLMDYAGRVGGIVVGTGDLSELALGWCTYNADHMSMYGVNAGVPKTVIPLVIRATMKDAAYAKAADILEDVIDTPISPELLPPDDQGVIAQQTEDLVGPYALHDFFLYYVMRYGFAPAKIYAMACRVFSGEFDGATVKKWLGVFYKRFFTQQFKRSCLPEGVKVFDISVSPRGDWQMPSDATADVWLRQVEKL